MQCLQSQKTTHCFPMSAIFVAPMHSKIYGNNFNIHITLSITKSCTRMVHTHPLGSDSMLLCLTAWAALWLDYIRWAGFPLLTPCVLCSPTPSIRRSAQRLPLIQISTFVSREQWILTVCINKAKRHNLPLMCSFPSKAVQLMDGCGSDLSWALFQKHTL